MKKTVSGDEIDAVISILNKFQTSYRALSVPTCSFKDLFVILNAEEQRLVRQLCDLDPKLVDSEKGAHNELDELVTPLTDDYSNRFVRVHKIVFEAFEKMNAALKKEAGQQIYIISGYRSPAYQALIFLRELYDADFDIAQAQRVAKLPSRSQHGNYPFHAVDVAIKLALGDKKEISTSFEKTDAYHWMINHASEFGFSLTYPDNNQKDTIFEPWHWLYATSD
jgi:LAS superfamily LD-carboxypeptidase LdcB